MYFLFNVLGLIVMIVLIYFCSPNKRRVKWKSIVTLLVVELLITWFMLSTKIGSWMINKIASFFNWLIACANEGTSFVFPSVMANEQVDFFFSVLMPIIFIITFFDILTYFGILTWIIDKVGWLISKISGLPKLESFFWIQMMFLGNTEALDVIRQQLSVLKEHRLLTFGKKNRVLLEKMSGSS